MKLNYFLAIFALFIATNTSFAQCVPGAVTPAIWGTPGDTELGFTLDSVLTDVDTMKIVQGVDTSIILQYLLPTKQDITSPIVGTATVESVQILGVTNMPTGINWTLDAAAAANNNTYYPQNYRYGSVTVCGTTYASPGLKVITVSAEGCGSLAGFTECQGQSFELYIEVLPGSGGNSAFTFTPPVGCNSMDVDLEAIFQSPDPVLFPVDFEWDLGDGTTATGTTVSAHHYTTPGVYPVKLDVIINEFYISYIGLSNITGIGGFFDEGGTAADAQGSVNGIILPERTNDPSPSWNIDAPLGNNSVNTSFVDVDLPPINANDDLGSWTYNIPNFELYDGSQIDYGAGNYDVTLILNKRPNDTLTFWDTVYVYPSSVATVTSTNGMNFCGNDSTYLTVGAGYDAVQWYEDTTLLIGETHDTLKVNSSGTYHAVVLATGNICEGTSSTITISIDGIVTPVIYANGNSLEIDNPNVYDVQWYSNGIPIPGATTEVLTDLSSGNPFSVVVTNAAGCVAASLDFEACIGGYADAPNGTAVDGAVATSFNAVGFAYNSQTQIGWSVTPVADGMISTEAELAAINNENVYVGVGDQIDLLLNCNSLQGEGDYYLTPFLMDAVELPEFPFPFSDSTCKPQMNLAIGFDCTNPQWAIADVVVKDPAGNNVDILALSPIPISYPLNPELICGALGGNLPEISLFDLAPNSNPNGVWTIEVQNEDTASGTMNITVPVFQISLLAADCSDISADMIYDFGPYNLSIAPGETQSLSIKIPPLPTNYPSVTSSCAAFGTPVEIQVTNCVSSIDDVVNTANINLFPNPNNGMFTLNFDVLERNEVSLSIMDVTGRTIMNRAYNSIEGKFNESFDLKNNLNPGFYFMNIKVGNYTTQQKFIVK